MSYQVVKKQPETEDLPRIPEGSRGLLQTFVKKSSSVEEKHTPDEAVVMISVVHFCNEVGRSKSNKMTEITDVSVLIDMIHLLPALYSADGKEPLGTSVGRALDLIASEDGIKTYNEPDLYSVIGIHAALHLVAVNSRAILANRAARDAIASIFVQNSRIFARVKTIYDAIRKTAAARYNLLFAIMRIFIESSSDSIEITAERYRFLMRDSFLLFIKLD